MPHEHRQYLEWTPERIKNWDGKIGPQTKMMMHRNMESKKHPEQGIATIGTASMVPLVNPEKTFASNSLGLSVTVFRLRTRNTRSCAACKEHHKYNIFISYAFADRNRAHPGCNCPIVKQKLPRDVFRELFIYTRAINQGYIDLRSVYIFE